MLTLTMLEELQRKGWVYRGMVGQNDFFTKGERGSQTEERLLYHPIHGLSKLVPISVEDL